MITTSPLDTYRTLLLDSSFRPIKVVSWQKALTYLIQGKVLVVETYDRIVRSPSCEFVLPAVVALKQYLRYRPFRVRYSKRNVFIRDGYICQYCGEQPGVHQLTVDHVLPSSRGGRTIWENVVTACGPCNHRKGDQTPREAKMPLLSVPVRPTPSDSRLVGPQMTSPKWNPYLAKVG